MNIKPDYYKSEIIEFDVIDLVKAFSLNFNEGNILKYITRAGRKTDDRLSDLRKAKEYLEREIEWVKENE